MCIRDRSCSTPAIRELAASNSQPSPRPPVPLLTNAAHFAPRTLVTYLYSWFLTASACCR
eukprot:3870503-Prymnesium_polylepis.1